MRKKYSVKVYGIDHFTGGLFYKKKFFNNKMLMNVYCMFRKIVLGGDCVGYRQHN